MTHKDNKAQYVSSQISSIMQGGFILTLLELLTDIDKRYPNVFTTEDKTRWVNEGMEKLASEIGLVDTALIETTAGVAIYQMPYEIRMENIKTLVVNEVPHVAVGENSDLVRPSYMLATEGYFALYPEPTKTGLIIAITYQAQPAVVEEDTDVIELRTKYISALKYYVMRIIAESNDDIAKANNFGDEYNSEIIRIKMDKYKLNGKYPTTRDVMKTSGKNRRLSRTRSGYYVEA